MSVNFDIKEYINNTILQIEQCDVNYNIDKKYISDKIYNYVSNNKNNPDYKLILNLEKFRLKIQNIYNHLNEEQNKYLIDALLDSLVKLSYKYKSLKNKNISYYINHD
ncbi:hypothetical protein MYSEV_095 [Mythimna separata entomopoxvirus 'L']|uniref:Uncharacterized protein n=1 Tax=Mythimna separata entomopoxvirus 'L' TaxID=1293572 RepID=A0A916KQ23_9POXV|nr:hypothetical protein MYSEV_095 [Mythimna separata entomopoxvirus 'L']CCU56293.1 hypothetical protein MYSEV_095 [Mythimna separata entomopoxvirus 'L']